MNYPTWVRWYRWGQAFARGMRRFIGDDRLHAVLAGFHREALEHEDDEELPPPSTWPLPSAELPPRQEPDRR
jgi:hypothetical protein